jgi:hypothetical protein
MPTSKISMLTAPAIPQIVADWLKLVLPANAHTKCSNVYVATASLPFQQRLLHDFASREDLIDGLRAAVSIPLLSYPCWLNESGPNQENSPTLHFDACMYSPGFEHVKIDPQVTMEEMATCTEEAAVALYECGLQQISVADEVAAAQLQYQRAGSRSSHCAHGGV